MKNELSMSTVRNILFNYYLSIARNIKLEQYEECNQIVKRVDESFPLFKNTIIKEFDLQEYEGKIFYNEYCNQLWEIFVLPEIEKL